MLTKYVEVRNPIILDVVELYIGLSIPMAKPLVFAARGREKNTRRADLGWSRHGAGRRGFRVLH